jgi:Cytochrome c554 and c-prime
MRQKVLAILGCSLALLVFAASHGMSTVAAAPAASTAPAHQTDGYVGADACKDCHPKYFDAWSGTKHKNALTKLGTSDMNGEKCIGCHVTGTPDMIKADGAKPRYPGVQCESCHGGGAVHVEQAKAKAMVKGAIVKTPEEDNCTKCHSDKSPHYKPFVYSGMKNLVHAVKK